MDARHEEYVAYYRARMERRAESGLYPESAAAEEAMHDALAGCARLEEFREKAPALAFACEKARVLDQARARLAVWQELGEDVRALEEAQLIREVPAAKDAAELHAIVRRASKAAREAITVDEFHRVFIDDLEQLEELEVLERAEIPARWKEKDRAYAEREVAKAREDFQEKMARLREHVADARFDVDVVPAPRHRRLMPFPDAVLQRRFAAFRHYRGV